MLLARLLILCCIAQAQDSAQVYANASQPQSSAAINTATRQCIVRNKDAQLQGIAKSLQTTIAASIGYITSRNIPALTKQFHPRLQRAGIDLPDFFKRIEMIYRKPYKVNIARLWELQPAGEVEPITCAADSLQLKPMYGFKQQFFLWLSVIGNSEMGRVLIVYVPNTKTAWHIAALHSQQWTHQGHDFNLWLQQAGQDKTMLAYVKYDIAAKLLQDSPFISFPQTKLIRSKQQQLISTANWESKIKAALQPRTQVLAIETILAAGGVGILLRLGLPSPLSGTDSRKLCASVLQQLQAKPWFQGFAGVKCSFVLKGEDPSKEGVLGGLYMPAR